ncbi:MAG: murein hydrolase activator EnvC [Flavobacteriaceae bacterium]
MMLLARHLRIGVLPACLLVMFVALCGAPAPAWPADADKTRAELEDVQDDLEESRARAAALKAEAEALSRDRKGLSDQLVDTAERIRAAETRLVETEGRLAALSDEQAKVESVLGERRAELAVLLAGLERLGRNPPPAVVVRPEDALSAVRSAMALGAVLPELRGRAERVAADLAELQRLRREAGAERTRIAARSEILENERQRLSSLVSLRQQSEQEALGKLAEAQAMTNNLARRSQTLRDLLAAIEKAASGAGAPLPDESKLAALTDSHRLGARVPFERAIGRLRLPVSGPVETAYGTPDRFGGEAHGISFASRDGETVTSPCDAWIVYSGPFRSYGQLLILNAGDGYHVVLAGLERISVSLGQFVLAGEPVGTMGSAEAAAARSPAENAARTPSNKPGPVLYVEFRKDGSAIDPSPWWAASRQGVQG